jgi:hypothetical protein
MLTYADVWAGPAAGALRAHVADAQGAGAELHNRRSLRLRRLTGSVLTYADVC